MSFLLRVSLPDRPGSLGSLAVALGRVGADILSLDVVERGIDYAVDDLVVDIASGTMPDSLITAAEQLDGVHVDSIRPYSGLLDAHRELELIDQVAGAGSQRWNVLVESVPRVLRVGWCTVLAPGPAGPYRLFASSGAPETHAERVDWWPVHKARVLDNEASWVPGPWKDADTMLAVAPLGTSEKVLLLGRPGGPEFRPSEVARLGYLSGIVATVLV